MPETEGMDRLSRLVAELQQQIEEAERAIFSPTVLELARQPRNMGVMLEPDGHALFFGPCGDTMEIFLRLDGRRIQVAAFHDRWLWADGRLRQHVDDHGAGQDAGGGGWPSAPWTWSRPWTDCRRSTCTAPRWP
jgi:hypothetical protein